MTTLLQKYRQEREEKGPLQGKLTDREMIEALADLVNISVKQLEKRVMVRRTSKLS